MFCLKVKKNQNALFNEGILLTKSCRRVWYLGGVLHGMVKVMILQTMLQGESVWILASFQLLNINSADDITDSHESVSIGVNRSAREELYIR